MKYILLASVLALVTATGCQHEELTVNNPAGNDILNFSVGFAGNGEIVLSKGATLTSQDGTVSIPLSCAVTDGINVNLPGAAESAKATKGTQINSEAEFLGEGLTSFTAAGWNSDKSAFIPSSTAVSYSGGKWKTEDTYGWRGNGDKVFLAYANLPVSDATVTNYVDPSVKQTFTYTVPTDARQQNDIMLGWYEGDGGGTATAAITMVHPLTAVVFKAGEIDECVTAIKSISITGVYVSGQADVTYDLSGNDIVPSYNWSDSRTGSQTVTLGPAEGASELEVADDGKIGTSFIILPQTVAAGALTLTITVVKDGEEAVLLADVPAGTWQEGKTNVYTLGYDGGDKFIEISIDDEVNGNVKENVVIKSTENSTVKCYIRALIIGNWCQNLGTASEPVPGAIMAPWSLTDGNFEGLPATVGLESDSHWVLGSDGFYYYKYPVYPNRETGKAADDTGTADKLFVKYTAPENAPLTVTYLNLSIIAQAVKWDADKTAAKEAWGETAAGYLSATVKGSSN